MPVRQWEGVLGTRARRCHTAPVGKHHGVTMMSAEPLTFVLQEPGSCGYAHYACSALMSASLHDFPSALPSWQTACGDRLFRRRVYP